MKEERKNEWKGAIKAILVVGVLCVGIGIAVAAWDDTKIASDALTAAEWNAQVSDQKARISPATTVIAASDSLNTSKADYVCDGSDDQITINNAISAMPNIGGTLYFLEGNYDITDQINLTSNLTVAGTGWGTKMNLQAELTQDYSIFMGNDVSRVVVKDMFIDLGGYLVGAGVEFMSISSSMENIEIKNVKVTGTNNEMGISIYGNDPHKISNVLIDGCNVVSKKYGIYLGGDWTTAAVHRFAVTNNKVITTNYNPIAIYNGAEEGVVANNVVYGGGHSGIALSYARYVTVVGNSVSGIPGGDEAGIELEDKHQSPAPASNVSMYNTITGNVVRDCNWGILLREEAASGGGADYNVVTGNVVTGCTKGIYIENGACQNNSIVANIVHGNTADIEDSGTNTLVENNME